MGTTSIYRFLDGEIDREKPISLKIFDTFKEVAKISSLILYINLLVNIFSKTSIESGIILNGSWLFYGIAIPINIGLFKYLTRNIEEDRIKNKLFILSLLGVFFIHLGVYKLIGLWGLDLELLEINRLNYILATIILSSIGRLSIKVKNP